MADNRTANMVEVVPPGSRIGKRGAVLREQRKMNYYRLDERNGAIIEMHLPSDGIFYRQYLERGFVTERSLLEERSLEIKRNLGLLPDEKSQEATAAKEVPHQPEEEVNPLVCEICGKECRSAFGLQAHMKKHNH